ncbi:MAG: hypothetical protein MZV70_68835 [Desulfobacterales bacterium]|nr:hypothetical protein [Desulfobacterales bacterium]
MSETVMQAGETRPDAMGLGGTVGVDGTHAGSPRKGGEGGVWFSLIDKVYRPSTLYAAWLSVKANKGSAGSDHQSIEAFERNLTQNLGKLEEEIRSGQYRPRPIRRVYIDKPGSKDKRPAWDPRQCGTEWSRRRCAW